MKQIPTCHGAKCCRWIDAGGISPKVWQLLINYVGDVLGVGLTTPNFVLERALNRATPNLTETPKNAKRPGEPGRLLDWDAA
jgi:hypothetical protein